MQTSGYSTTPLAKKLGIKEGNKLLFHNLPEHYFMLFDDLPEELVVLENPKPAEADFIHLFFTKSSEFQKKMPLFKKMMSKTGMLWVSWPKGDSEIETDLKRDPIRAFGLQLGLVDVKVCAVDQDWSGLKFVYRKKDR